MRISVNLATRPFVELRPLYARLRLAMVALTVLAAGLAIGLHFLNAKAAVAASQMDALKAKTVHFQQERAGNEARMRQPQNMAVLERSQFLNAVFAQKSFSWTSVMMDLEKVLPAGLQVTSIDPQISKEGDVSIRLRVSGDRDRGVQLVRNLETSQRFLAPRLAGEQALAAEGNQGNRGMSVAAPGSVVFEITSGYNPLPLPAVNKNKEKSRKAEGTDAADSAKDKASPKKPGVKRGTSPAASRHGVPAAGAVMTPKGGAR